MSYTLEVNLPNLTPGAEVEVDKLGIFQNGETYEISPEQANHFATMHGRTLGRAFLGHPHISAIDPDEDLSDDPAEDDPEYRLMELNEFTVPDLKQMIEDLNGERTEDQQLSTSGNKPELVARIQEAEGAN